MNSSNMCGDWDFDKNEKWPAGCSWRGAASVISGVAWLCFNIIWLFFYAGDHTIWENIGVFLLSIVAVLGFNALAWVGYGLSMAKDHKDLPRYRIIGSMLVLGAGTVSLLTWLFFLTDGYNVYQNIAVLTVIVLLTLGSCAALWIGYDEKKCFQSGRDI